MIDEIPLPELQMTPTVAQVIVKALSDEYKQEFYYTKEFSKNQNSDMHYITTAYSKNMVIINPKLRILYVENKGKKVVDIQKVKQILLDIIDQRKKLAPAGKDIAAYTTVEKKLPVSEDVSAKIGSYLTGESGTLQSQKESVGTKMKKYGLTKKGGRKRKSKGRGRRTRRR